MATQDRASDNPIEDRLKDHSLVAEFLKEAHRFSFFQLVHLLERYCNPDAPVGLQGPASKEVIRFCPEASLSFPFSDIAAMKQLSPTEEGVQRFQIITNFLGLYGTTSPLPTFYTEDILWRNYEADQVRDFIDLFHHRLLSLFYRSWLKYRYDVQFEYGGKDEFSRRMFALIGLGTNGLAEHTGLPSIRLIRYVGLLSQQPRSASALEGILGDFFEGIRVRIEQCTARWISIKPEQRAVLGQRSCQLGVDCLLGERIYNRTIGFRIVIGPLTYDLFLQFLPDGKNFRMIYFIVRLFISDRLGFDVELLVHERGIPPLQLLSNGKTDIGGRLGWTSWLLSDRSEGVQFRSLVLKGGLP